MKKLSNLVILAFLWLLVLSMILEKKEVKSRAAEDLQETVMAANHHSNQTIQMQEKH